MSSDAWIAALIARHTASLTRPEFLKAVRALSVRYVERRGALGQRSALDSAGKRAAFAAYYAPLHFLTVQRILQQLDVRASIDTIVDLGCGTGVAAAALALSFNRPPAHLHGVDVHPWVLEEAKWNWTALGLSGTARRGSIEQRLAALAASRSPVDRTALVCGWSLNELEPAARVAAIAALLDLAARGAAVFVIEPVARRLVPWWDEVAARAIAAGGRADEWKFPPELPPALADLDEAAGFDRDSLSARSILFA